MKKNRLYLRPLSVHQNSIRTDRSICFSADKHDTVIGSGITVNGALRCLGDIIVEGGLTGSIQAKGGLTSSANSNIKATIVADSVIISGQVEGDIESSGEIIIRATGRLTGDVSSLGLTIFPGGMFNGRSRLRDTKEKK
jgi:cytoskeletal protein CcmA (bactofilin family)